MMSNLSHLPLLLLLLLLLTSLSPLSADTTDATSFVYAGCSQPKYTPGSSYEFNLDSLLSSLSNAAGFTSYTNFTSSATTPFAPAFGLFQCRVDLSISTCSSCVQSSLSQLSSLCPAAAGAAIQLHGCFLRFGNDSFVGRPDTSLLYKKCGPLPNTQGTNPNILSMRDAALVAMQAAVPVEGTYRAGAAGFVQAVGQCVGDISRKDCSNCVSIAAAQLRDACGLAISGDLYLGKCYASYWSNGFYTPHSNCGGEKTWAIVIGISTGVALIIVFLSFISRTCAGK